MWHHLLILADSDQLIYIIAVVIMFVVGWIVERAKKLMAEQGKDKPYRPPVPPVRRPPIPPLRDSSETAAPSRPMPPAAGPRPPVRPPVPGQQRRPAAGQTARPPAAPAGQRPGEAVARRTIEERKAVIRGESQQPMAPRRTTVGEIARTLAVPGRAAPAAARVEPAAAVPEDEASHRVQMTTVGREVGHPAEGKPLSLLRPLRAAEAAHVPPNVAARSFRRLSIADLQRALVLKEILEPPLAMREE